MSHTRAAIAAAILCLGASAPVLALDTLSLADAFTRVIETHPDLAALRYADIALAADVERAAQKPPLQMQASAENVLGTGAASGISGAELTLSLASVLERTGKREARIDLANRLSAGVDLQREAKRLDLLAEVARRYLDALSARAIIAITREDLAQRKQLVDAAAKRRSVGAVSESVVLTAEATQLRVAAALAQAQRRALHARRRLAALWGATTADFELVATDLSDVPAVPNYDDLIDRLAQTPEIRRFAHEARVREARLQLARSARVADVEWQLGLRRLQAQSDWGLVGSVSIPFGSAARAEPAIRAADAQLSSIEFEREAQNLALQSTLAEAWSQLDMAAATVQQIDSELLPALQRAAAATERAYRAGAFGYLEWAQLQTDITATRRERLDASLMAHRALIELQRLTGQTFAVGSATNTEHTP